MNSKTVNIITWVLQVLVSITFFMAGGTKVTMPYEQLTEILPWTKDFSPTFIIIIGALEILGVIGMNLPLLIKKFQFLTPIATICLAGTMIGAAIVHYARDEPFVMQLALMFLLFFIAYVRLRRTTQNQTNES